MQYTLMRAQFCNLSWFPFVQRSMEKNNNKKCVNFRFTSWKISNFNRVCMLMLLSLGCNLVMWHELIKSIHNVWLFFPIPFRAERKPTWRSRVWWLAKLHRNDAAWKLFTVYSPFLQQCTTEKWIVVFLCHLMQLCRQNCYNTFLVKKLLCIHSLGRGNCKTQPPILSGSRFSLLRTIEAE